MPVTVVTNTDNVTITGPLTVQNDPMGTVATLSLDNGNMTSDGSGNITMVKLKCQSIAGGVQNGGATSLAQTVNAAATITNGSFQTIRIAAGAATTTSCALTTGTVDGQDLTVVNISATNVVISTNVGVASTVVASGAASFKWDAGTTLWYHRV